MRPAFVFIALALVALSSAIDDNKDARILCSKFLLSAYAVENKEFIVDYNLYNVGDKHALHVELSDDSFSPEYFDIVRGMLKVKWDRIAAGSNVSHSVILRPKTAGRFNFTAAVIRYLPHEDATEPRVGFSSQPGTTDVYWLKDYERRFSPHLADWGLFALMTLPSIAVPYFLWTQSRNRYERVAKDK